VAGDSAGAEVAAARMLREEEERPGEAEGTGEVDRQAVDRRAVERPGEEEHRWAVVAGEAIIRLRCLRVTRIFVSVTLG